MINPLTNVWESQIERAITDWGRSISLIWGSTVECNSCEWDPINKEATNIACTTCGGLYYYFTESTVNFKGAVKKFLGNMGMIDYSQRPFGFVPDHDARITCWLDDLVVIEDSAAGPSYLDADKVIRLEIDGQKYEVLSFSKTGVEEVRVGIVTLREIKGE